VTPVLALLVGALVGAAVAWVVLRHRAPSAAGPPELSPALPPRVLEEALSTLAAGAVVLDGRDRVVLANHTAEDLKLVRGRALAIPALGRLVADLRRTGLPAEVELDMPGGPDLAAVRVRAALAGTTGHAVLLVDDITEARRVEAVRRDFVANVSHELKTPVGALALLAEAIHDGEGDAETVRRFAGRMVH